MKRWIFFTVAILVVIGAGAILLTTRQAPTTLEAASSPAADAISGITDEVPAPLPVSDVASVKRLSTEEFRALGAEVMKALPNKNDLQRLREAETHGTPPALIAAGIQLGKIAEAVANEPALEAEGITLYRECAASPQHPDSVRALCYSNYKRLSEKAGIPVNQYVVSKSLRQLAEKLDF
ncbi:MAG: hypothetical protein AB7K68_12430 [Bacteriovoracia bacterium]